MANKYLQLGTSGFPEEAEANAASAGAGDAGKLVALNASGDIDASMLPPGAEANVETIECTETLTDGNFVNIYESTGVKCRKADATDNTKPAHGFVLANVTSGQNASVYTHGVNNGLTGLNEGVAQFLHTTAGERSETPPSSTGNVVQRLGFAISPTELDFFPGDPIKRA